MTHPLMKALLWLGAALVLSLCLRLEWIASSQLELARQAEQTQQPQQAIIHYERAIHAYLPWLSSREAALHDMQNLVRTLEAEENAELALQGWRRLRGAILSTRSIFGQPDKDVLLEADRNIARLAAATDAQGMMSKSDIEKEASVLLAKNPQDISAFWGVAQFILLLAWVAAACGLIWHWAPMSWRRRSLWAGGAAISWLGWLAVLYLAG